MMMIKESSIPWVWQWLRDGQDLCHFFSLLNHESSLAPRLLMFVDNSDDNDSKEEENDVNNQLQKHNKSTASTHMILEML